MVAALYGELSESEERAFKRLLEKDPTLRAEWEELSEGRQILAGWEVEERVPSFILVEGEEEAPVARPAGEGLFARLRSAIAGLGAGPAWGLATATAAFFAFVIADARFQSRLERELAARDAESMSAPAPRGSVTPRDPFAELGNGRPVLDDSSGEIRQVSSDKPFVTTDDLQSYNSELMTTLVELLNQYDARRADEVNGLVQALYERLNSQQVFDYRQVNNRIDAVGTELLLQKDRHERALDELLGPARFEETPTTGMEE
jgi:hypothetical protein